MVYQPQHIPMDRQLKRFARCRPGLTEQTPEHSPRNAADGFLRAEFLPVRASMHKELENRKAVEKQFFASLENLAALYGFKPLAKCNAVYPHNIARAFQHASWQVTNHCRDTNLAIIKDDTHLATVVSYRELFVGQTLYYIPIKLLWDLMQDESRKQQVDLLLSVFAYLSQIAGLPMYTEPLSYLCNQYEMVFEWYSTDEDLPPEDWEEIREEYYRLQKAGNRLQRELSKSVHIGLFEQRLNSFEVTTDFDAALKEIAAGFFCLYREYPAQSIFGLIPQGFEEPQQEQRIDAWQYLSFIWDLDSQMTCDLFTAINCELQEYAVMDSPVTVQYFDTPQTSVNMSLDFPIRFFSLLDDLADFLKTT